jgi:serine protease Do
MKRSIAHTVVIALIAGLAARVAAASPDDARASRRTPVVTVFEAARNSVVNISSTHIVQVDSPFGFDRMFDDFFNRQPRGRVRQYRSVGSGFVFHEAGYIITNAHVVAQTAERKVIFADESEYDAQVIAIDQDVDLAVLKIDVEPGKTITPLPLGRSDDLMVGETVIAIGNPLGYQHTVTAGVVSALNREIRVDEQHGFTGLIQTDASINPGNSGGPLLNVLGELIGVNTAIRGDAQNIGFAIPVDQLRTALPELLDIERRQRITTGMSISNDHRCMIVRVDGQTPAGRAGIDVGDRVMKVDGKPITQGIDYHIALLGRKAGDVVHLTLDRDGRTIDAPLTLLGRPKPDGAKLLQQRFGIEAAALNAQTNRQLGISERVRGLVITDIARDSPAAQSGLRRADIITAIGRYEVRDMDSVGELLEEVGSGQDATMDVLRIRRGVIFRQRVRLRTW